MLPATPSLIDYLKEGNSRDSEVEKSSEQEMPFKTTLSLVALTLSL